MVPVYDSSVMIAPGRRQSKDWSWSKLPNNRSTNTGAGLVVIVDETVVPWLLQPLTDHIFAQWASSDLRDRDILLGVF